MTQSIPLALLAFALQGCLFNSVAKLKPEAAKVQVVPETEKPSDCKFLGKIVGTSHADDEKTAKQGAENDLRNKAAALKANFAIVENTRGGRVGTTSQRDVVINGKAYDCKTLEMQQAEEEKHAQAIAEQEEREAKEKAEQEAKAEEAKAKREQEEREAKEKEAKEKEEEKARREKRKKGDSDD